MAISEIQRIQILAVDKMEKSRSWITIPWEQALPELESLIWARLHNAETNRHPKLRPTQLLRSIADNGEFMLALVFQPDHHEAKALPLPELFDDEKRIPLGLSRVNMAVNVDGVVDAIRVMRDHERSSSVYDIHTIVIEQNLGQHRNLYPLSIGFWDTIEAGKHGNAKHYEQWIDQVRQELTITGRTS